MNPTELTAEPDVTFEVQYSAALSAYVAYPDESLLSRAYELGREALVRGDSIPDVVAVYGKALAKIAGCGDASQTSDEIPNSAAAFLANTLSPFEMTHRGYREGVLALRHVNENLEKEVQRIAHALHDEAGQLLASVYLELNDLQSHLPISSHPRLGKLQGLLDQIEMRLRQLSHELRPTVLDDLGWLPAIEFLAASVAKRAQLPIRVHSTVSQRLPTNVETALYRIVQEALTNATRHAKASCIHIAVDQKSDRICCLISDDGVGFDVGSARKHGGLGIQGMQERLRALNGSLQIDSSPGYGTQIRMILPMEI